MLIVIGGVVAIVDWKNLASVGLVMMLVAAYVLVRSVLDLRHWYDHEKVHADTYEATIADSGITVKGATSTGQYDWAHLTGYRNTPNITVVFHCKSYIALPNSGLSSQALADMRTVIASHLEPFPDTTEKVTKLQILFVVTVLALAIFFLGVAVRDHLNNAH